MTAIESAKRCRIPILLSVIVLCVAITGCDGDSKFVGTWKATSVNMGDKAPPEAAKEWLAKNPLQVEIKSDQTATIVGGGVNSSGQWSVDGSVVTVNCPAKVLILQYDGRTLTTLPDKTFVFERQ